MFLYISINNKYLTEDLYLLLENENPYIIDKSLEMVNNFALKPYENKSKINIIISKSILINNQFASFERINFSFVETRNSVFLDINSTNVLFKVLIN